MPIKEMIKALLSRTARDTSTYTALCAGWVMITMMLLVTYETLLRYALAQAVNWALEFSELLLSSIIFMGLAYTTRSGGHVSVDTVTIHFSQRVRHLLGAATSFVATVVSAYLVWQLVGVFRQCLAENWRTSTAVPLVVWPFYVVPFVGCFLMTIEWIRDTAANLLEFRHLTRQKPRKEI